MTEQTNNIPTNDPEHVRLASQASEGETARPEDSLSQPVTPAHSEKIKVVFKECQIAGWNFHVDEDLWEELHEGAQLALIRDRKNIHDHNAVAVALAGDYDGHPENFDFDFIIGYVPRTENEFIAKMMDLGWSDAFTAKLTTLYRHGAYPDRLRMTIYLQSRKAEERTERFFTIKMDDSTFADFTGQLYYQGYYYLRWACTFFEEQHSIVPEKGDKVVFIHTHDNHATLYIMHMVAVNEHAVSAFNIPKEELEMVDDCMPCVLTNVKGPAACSNREIAFLNDGTCEYESDGILTEDAVERLKELFNR